MVPSIRCENGESEQTRLNLRATLREVATVLAGILSADASGMDARKGRNAQQSGAEHDSPAHAVGTP